jgi:hypothetical protein
MCLGWGAIGLVGCGPGAQSEQPVQEVRGAPIQTTAKKSEAAREREPARATNAVSSIASSPVAAATASQPKDAGYTFEVSDEVMGPITNDLAAAAEKTNAKIPNTVKAYDQKKVALRGFMLPLKVEGGLVTEMLIMKDQSMCCYGAAPRINDWVSVRMKNKGVRPTMDLPVTLRGTMRVGEMRENGYLVGIYSMDGEEMDAPDVQ